METELADKARLIAVVNKAIDEAVVRTREAEALQTLAQSEEQIESRRAEEKATRAKSVDICSKMLPPVRTFPRKPNSFGASYGNNLFCSIPQISI